MFSSVLSKMVLAVVFLMVVISIIFLFFSNIGETDFECKSSVKTYSQELLLYNIIAPSKVDELASKLIHCPAKKITLDGDKAGMSKVLADEMVRCWNNFGEGKLNLFPNSDGVFCSICSIVDVKKEIINFPSYLSSNFYGGDLYVSYLTGKTNQEYASISSELSSQKLGSIKEGKYAVSLIYAKGQNLKEFFSRMSSSTEGQVSIISGITSVGAGVLLVSNPVGLTVGLFLGVVAVGGVITSYVSYRFFDQKTPYAAFVSVEPYNSENINTRCTAMPVRL